MGDRGNGETGRRGNGEAERWRDKEAGNGETEKRSIEKVTHLSSKELKKITSGFKEIVLSSYDKTYGGFGSSQKIPYADVLESLLYLYEEEKDKKWLDMVTNSLDHMAGLRQKGDDKRPEPEYLIDLYKNRDRKDWVDKVIELQKKYKLSGLYDRIDGDFSDTPLKGTGRGRTLKNSCLTMRILYDYISMPIG